MRTLPTLASLATLTSLGCAAATGAEPLAVDPAGGPAARIDDVALARVDALPAATGAEVRASGDEPFYHAEPIYSVVMVEAGDVLDVRAGAGTENDVIDTLAPESTEITGTGREEVVGDQRWIEILLPTGSGTGWVNAFYLTEVVLPARFCADGEVADLLVELETALRDSNGERLFATVSPTRGLSVRLLPNGVTHRFDDQRARGLFEERGAIDWGTHPYTGERLRGSFSDLVASDLAEMATHPNTAPHCNELPLGGHAWDARFPTELANFNFYALHFAGTTEYDGMDWTTWVVAVDYSEGTPYVVGLEKLAR